MRMCQPVISTLRLSIMPASASPTRSIPEAICPKSACLSGTPLSRQGRPGTRSNQPQRLCPNVAVPPPLTHSAP